MSTSALGSPAFLLVLLLVAVTRHPRLPTGPKVAVVAVLSVAFAAILFLWFGQFIAQA